MKTIKSIYKVGNGPSSSHTFGPQKAARYIKNKYTDIRSFRVTLYGSLAETGKGHGTDAAILSVLPDAEIIFNCKDKNIPHPNTMLFECLQNDRVIAAERVFSIGGGEIQIEGVPREPDLDIYKESSLSEILNVCENENISLPEYAYRNDEPDLKEYLSNIWGVMKKSIHSGLNSEGILPGGLNIERKARLLSNMRCYNEDADIAIDRIICSFAYAVSEENACGNEIVTAPTCGSAGVIPAVFYYMNTYKGFPDEEIVDALAVAGIIGNVIRTNASISGAECGCQAEIGSACSMAAAGLASLYKLGLSQVEYSAEVAMEHHLGLTCDPVKGLVQIPCIERNAVAAMRAINSVNLARFLYSTRKISFDAVIDTMYRTGNDLKDKYRETSSGGLAALY